VILIGFQSSLLLPVVIIFAIIMRDQNNKGKNSRLPDEKLHCSDLYTEIFKR
jgi:hypothetical protein